MRVDPRSPECAILCSMQRLVLVLLSCFALLMAAAGSLSAGAQKKSDKIDYYRKWLNEDVVYIITE